MGVSVMPTRTWEGDRYILALEGELQNSKSEELVGPYYEQVVFSKRPTELF